MPLTIFGLIKVKLASDLTHGRFVLEVMLFLRYPTSMAVFRHFDNVL
ncbi:MAG: hypothetical protein IJI45_13140 [Anaerolineaceae bacterium]|nr:hypothetical protein [Anaerolineaceae bacterium]